MTLNYTAARKNMVESQIRTNDVSDLKLIEAISNVKREDFVEENAKKFAYSETYVSSDSGRVLLKARDFAKLAQGLKLNPNESLLIIGGSAGYSSEVFKELTSSVSTYDNVGSCDFSGDLINLNLPSDSKFDAIFVDIGVEYIPNSWFSSLKENGRLAVIVKENNVGRAKIFVKSNGSVSSVSLFEANPPVASELKLKKEFEF